MEVFSNDHMFEFAYMCHLMTILSVCVVSVVGQSDGDSSL